MVEITIVQYLILGLIQGITEWIPISSSGMLSLYSANFLEIQNFGELVELSLFLHLGTFFAALIYFWNDVKRLMFDLFSYKKINKEEKNILNFYIIATLVGGIFGFVLLMFAGDWKITGQGITLFVGLLLIFTGAFQLWIKTRGEKNIPNLKDSFIVGISQALATLPGVSRSGITVSALLLRRIKDTNALKYSFILSLPIVLIGNLVLNIDKFNFNSGALIGLISAFVFGFLTIGFLMKISKRINFGWFCIGFGILMGLSLLI